MQHTLKIWPEPFKAVKEGSKWYEVRRADRPFSVGDMVEFYEFDPETKLCTGAVHLSLITYLTPAGTWGLPSDICVFGIMDHCWQRRNMEAKHLDGGKPGLQYILAMPGLLSVSDVGDFGAKKYGQWNYKAGMPWMKLLGSCTRHLTAFILGEDFDRESKLPHLAHLCYDALMLLDYMVTKPELDDRYKP